MRRLLLSLFLVMFLPSLASAQISPGTINARQTGTWTVQPGNTANTTAWLVTGTGGTFPVTGTVTANAGTNLNTSALALEASLVKLPLTQGSTTSGQSGALVQGAVTTSAPTYTTAQTSPLSLDTSGRLRMDVSSWIGSTAPTIGSKTSANSIPVVIASDQGAVSTTAGALTSITTGQQAVTATAAVLPTQAAKNVCIKVLIAGTQTVYYGPTGVTTATGQEISAGDASCMALDNVNRIFVIAGGTGSTVAWQALN